MAASLTPESWLQMTKDEVENLSISQNGTANWPFQNVSKIQLFVLIELMAANKNWLDGIMHIYGSLTASFGFICTGLLILSLYRKVFVDKNTFYAAMIIIAF